MFIEFFLLHVRRDRLYLTDDGVVRRGDLVVDSIDPHQPTFHLRVDSVVRPIVILHLAASSPARSRYITIKNHASGRIKLRARTV